MTMRENVKRYILECQEELKQLIRDLCAIPAPSNREEQRAAFCKKWFEDNGVKDVLIDEALNVICSHNVTSNNDLVVFAAHTDTVFPDLAPLPFAEKDGIMYCPGVTDDTAHLAVLMLCARYIIRSAIPTRTGILFVANSGEEGLGNLKGIRAVVAQYGSRMKAFITLDDTRLTNIVTRTVGSHRYRITATTDGGHSFRDFGNRNAIQVLASLVDALYRIPVPKYGDSHTTYNVGTFTGGTSVNTIAQTAEMLYEYRSDNHQCLAEMKAAFESAISQVYEDGATLSVENIGQRPCAGDVDPVAWDALIHTVQTAIFRVTGQEAVFTAGSTDCNIPLSIGVPSVCIGACVGGGCHTREEWLDTTSLVDGCSLFFEVFYTYCVNH